MKEILSGIRFIRSYTPRWDRDSMPPCFMNESVSDIDHLFGEDLETFREQAYQKRALWKMERRKKQPVQLKKKVHDHER